MLVILADVTGGEGSSEAWCRAVRTCVCSERYEQRPLTRLPAF